jgi:hypothetical protein
MKFALKVILVNLGALVGFFLVLFTVPSGTSFTLLGVACGTALVAVNIAVFVWPRYRRRETAAGEKRGVSTAVVILTWLIFLLGLAWNWYGWHR